MLKHESASSQSNLFQQIATDLSDPEKLLQAIAAQQTDSEEDLAEASLSIKSRRISEYAPLSFSQERLWLLEQLEPNATAYQLPLGVRLTGQLDRPALVQSLTAIVRRHEILRTVFVSINGEIKQRILPPNHFALPLFDLNISGLSKTERTTILQNQIATERKRPFDLAKGPLWRARLIRLAAQEHVFLFTIHHIIVDGWSLSRLAQELTELYQAFVTNDKADLPNLPAQYADFALWQRQRLQGAMLEQQLTYWRERLPQPPHVLPLPTDHQRLPQQTFQGTSETIHLPLSLLNQLKMLGQAQGATLFMTVLSAFKILLARYTGQSDISVGTYHANRNHPDLVPLIGFFVNTLVLRTNLTGDLNFRAVLARVRQVTLGAYDHSDIPFERLLTALHPQRDPARSPFFQVMFVLQNMPALLLDLPGLTTEPLPLVRDRADFDLTLWLTEKTDGLMAALEYNCNLFTATTIRRLLAHFQNLLQAIVANPDQSIATLPMLIEAERQLLLQDWSQGHPVPKHHPSREALYIHTLFEEQAKQTPTHIAVIQEDLSLTYEALNQQANQLAHYLRKLGVAQEVCVGLCLPRSPLMIVALMAILKTGGAYVPLSVDWPQSRIAFVVREAEITIVLTQAHLAKQFNPELVSIVDLDNAWAEIKQESAANLTPTNQSSSLAYVIYTSGSTGKPKGVLVEHYSLARFSQITVAEYGLGRQDRMLQFADLSFDASIEEIFPCLLSGATLVLRTETMIDTAVFFWEQCRTWQLTVLDLPTAYWQELMAQAAMSEKFDLPETVRLVIIGGEPVQLSAIKTWQRLVGQQAQLVNTYGPTETTVVATNVDLSALMQKTDQPLTEVPLGRPLPGVELYVLDDALQLVPVGVSGILYLGGFGLARGYLKRADLNAAAFIPHPFKSQPGARLYNTGDIVRYRPDGQLIFVGRIDNQVKLRGFRIEVGEIESILHQAPFVHQAAVVVAESRTSGQQLIAYVVPQSSTMRQLNAGAANPQRRQQTNLVTELHNLLGDHLPHYMHPSQIRLIEKLPLTSEGKIDRRTLATLDNASADDEALSSAVPHTELERTLIAIWRDLLGVEVVSIDEDFFALGGDSLLATRLITRIQQTCGVALSLRTVFEATQIKQLAQEIEWAWRNQIDPQLRLTAIPRDIQMPLSFAQERIWFLHQLDPHSSAYNIPFAFQLTGDLSEEALTHSFNEIIRRHESLRTIFYDFEGVPKQAILPAFSLKLKSVDLRPILQTHLADPAAQATALVRLCTENARQPFDLSQGPLIRAILVRLTEATHRLQITLHHAIADAWSILVFARELMAVYRAFVADMPNPLPELPIQYTDFVHWQRTRENSDLYQQQLAYWRQQLADAPPQLMLPLDKPRTPGRAAPSRRQIRHVSSTLKDSLHTLSQQAGATLFMTLLAAFKLLLARYTGQDDIVVGTPVAGRKQMETEALIGVFLNTLILRTDLSGDLTFFDLLRRVREVALDAFAHQDVPFEQLLRALQPARDFNQSPLFQVLFNMLNVGGDMITQELSVLPNLSIEPALAPEVEAKFDLTLYVREQRRGISFIIIYNAGLFSAQRISDMLAQYEYLLHQLVAQPMQNLASFSLVPAVMAARLPNPTQPLALVWNGAVQDQFAARAKEAPERLALVDEHGSWTYAQLEARSTQLAHILWHCGIQRGDVIAINGNRCAGLVWAMLGILKAGAAFLILDPTYPTKRLIHYLRLAQAQGLLQLENIGTLAPELADFAATHFAHCWLQLPTTGAAKPLNRSFPSKHANTTTTDTLSEMVTQPDDLAYIAFTSGSTGEPKGVLGSHRPLSHFVQWHSRQFDLTQQDHFSMLSGLSHDPLLRDIFTPLWLGATLYIPSWQTLVNPTQLVAWLCRHQIDIAHLTPNFGQLLAEVADNEKTLLPLRFLFFGGDELMGHQVSQWRQAAPAAQIVNFYGATETPQAMSYKWVDTSFNANNVTRIPIGQGIADVQLLVLTETQMLAGVGEVGEIYIRTPYLTQGYIDDIALTTAHYVQNPLAKGMPLLEEGDKAYRTADKAYRTGDKGRYLPNGDVEFLGRIDDQLKIRGFRVEPGEIVQALREHPAVQQAAVIGWGEEAKKLCAYVVLSPETTTIPSDLPEFLQQKLPSYLLPNVYLLINHLPLTSNGKIDYQALPSPDTDRHRPILETPFEPPRSALENQLAEMWMKLLKLNRIGITDNFFTLGGHSLLAMQLLARLQKHFGVELPLRLLFERPTIANMAILITQQKAKQIKPERLEKFLQALDDFSSDESPPA